MNILLTAQISDGGTAWSKLELVTGQAYRLLITNKNQNGENVDMTGNPVALVMRRREILNDNDFEFTDPDIIYKHETQNHVTVVDLLSKTTMNFTGRYFVEYGYLLEEKRIYRTGYGTIEFQLSSVASSLIKEDNNE